MLKVAGRLVPRSKFMVSVLPEKEARNPSPHAGTRPMLLADGSVNHKLPSGPGAIPNGPCPDATGYMVIVPLVVMRPIVLPAPNQSAPSGPAVITCPVLLPGKGYSVTAPDVVMRPML